MNRLIVLILCAAGLFGQSTVNGNRTMGTDSVLDASGALKTKPHKSGLSASIPATCAVGETYFKTDATAGQNTFACTGVNTWTLQGSAPGMLDPGSPSIPKRTTLNVTVPAVPGTDYVEPSGNVATATALAAEPTPCMAGYYPLGIDSSGNSVDCTLVPGGSAPYSDWQPTKSTVTGAGTIYTASVPAGVPASGKCLIIQLGIIMTNAAAGTNTIQVTFGGASLSLAMWTPAQLTNGQTGLRTVLLCNDVGSTTAQHVIAQMAPRDNAINPMVSGTGTVNTAAGPNTLAFTTTGADASQVITPMYWLVQEVK